MTIPQIRVMADELGYTVSGNLKADIITSFLAAQSEAQR